jgi:hypothetical protein
LLEQNEPLLIITRVLDDVGGLAHCIIEILCMDIVHAEYFREISHIILGVINALAELLYAFSDSSGVIPLKDAAACSFDRS